jgi:GDPmannose 4,6-dehydratase
MKNALVTGINGQDGSYLAELLLEKGYNVYGVIRRKSVVDYGNVDHLKDKIHFIYADMIDQVSLINAVRISQPDEVYNLAAQSFVATSFEQPLATADINAIGVTNILEAIRVIKPSAKYYQASTSEMFGLVQEIPQKETTPFYPRSPYAVAKLYGHWITKNYRESYNMYACSGILFNHESERRGKEFVTRKITDGVARIKLGLLGCLELGNLGAKRDWGHSKDYVYAMWLMLQQNKPDDYVIATNETRTVREFVNISFKTAGIGIEWKGSGVDEKAFETTTGKEVVRVNPKFFRPAEVELLIGNPEKAEKELGWKRNISFSELVSRMVKSDIKLVENEIRIQNLDIKGLGRKKNISFLELVPNIAKNKIEV